MSLSDGPDKWQMDAAYEVLPSIYLELFDVLPELAQPVRDTLAAGRRGPLAVRIMLFPCYAVQMVCLLAQVPGIAIQFGSLLLLACWPETQDILHGLSAVLGTTKPGKALFKKWERLFAEMNFFLVMASLRTALGARHLVKTRLCELDSIFGKEGPNDEWASTMAEWRNARCEARFAKWYRQRRDTLLRKWMDLIDQTDVVWGEHLTIFEGIVAQISGPPAPISIAAIVGRIPATWQRVQQRAEDYLSKISEEQWPKSQNKFAKLLDTNSSTLRKAIEKSPRESFLQSWDRLKDEWGQNKRRTRSDQIEKPAVISLQDAPEPISDCRGGEDEAETRELLDQYSTDKLVEMLKDLFTRAMWKLGKRPSEIEREWSELEGECDNKEATAKLIVLLREQHRDMFDTDSKAKIRQRRKP